MLNLIYFFIFSIFGHSLDLTSISQDNSSIKYNKGSYNQAGICADIADELKKLGINITGLSNTAPLLRIERMLETGDIDIFLCMLKNAERAHKFHFLSTPLYTVNHIIVKNANNKLLAATPDPKTFDDLRKASKDFPILVPKGSSLVGLLTGKGILVDSGAVDEESVLRKIVAGRAKYGYFQDLSVIATLRNSSKFPTIEILPTVFYTETQKVAYSKKLSPEKVEQLEKAIKKLEASGALNKIKARYKKVPPRAL